VKGGISRSSGFTPSEDVDALQMSQLKPLWAAGVLRQLFQLPAESGAPPPPIHDAPDQEFLEPEPELPPPPPRARSVGLLSRARVGVGGGGGGGAVALPTRLDGLDWAITVRAQAVPRRCTQAWPSQCGWR
jgi:hypothetical protein